MPLDDLGDASLVEAVLGALKDASLVNAALDNLEDTSSVKVGLDDHSSCHLDEQQITFVKVSQLQGHVQKVRESYKINHSNLSILMQKKHNEARENLYQ